MDKWEVMYNTELCLNYFSVNVSVLAIVFRRQIKKTTILPEIIDFLKIVGEIQQLVWKLSQKIIRT